MMDLHLKWLSEHVRSTPTADMVQVLLTLDRAGWYVSLKVK